VVFSLIFTNSRVLSFFCKHYFVLETAGPASPGEPAGFKGNRLQTRLDRSGFRRFFAQETAIGLQNRQMVKAGEDAPATGLPHGLRKDVSRES